MKTDFGKILRTRRKSLGIKQEELENRLGKEDTSYRTYISKLERSDSNPSFSTIEKICDALGLTLSEFFSGVEDVKKEPLVVVRYRDKKSKQDIEKLKAEMIPIRVVKGLKAFTRDRDIAKELTAKYVYVEKSIIDKPKNIIGAEIEKSFVLSSIKLKKVIFLVDTIDKDLKSFGVYLIENEESGEVLVTRVEEQDNNFIFFEETAYIKRKSFSYIPKEFKICNRAELEPSLIRGKIVGIIGKL